MRTLNGNQSPLPHLAAKLARAVLCVSPNACGATPVPRDGGALREAPAPRLTARANPARGEVSNSVVALIAGTRTQIPRAGRKYRLQGNPPLPSSPRAPRGAMGFPKLTSLCPVPKKNPSRAGGPWVSKRNARLRGAFFSLTPPKLPTAKPTQKTERRAPLRFHSRI